jgi:hypothetical protein
MGDHYIWNGAKEHVLGFGDPGAPTVLFIQPFFEEANRMRRVIVSVMRALADAGYHAVLPDLPGTGESKTRLDQIGLEDWRGALRSYASSLLKLTCVASFRAGSLIDDASGAAHLWRCSPETGARLVRDLMRTRLTSAQNQDAEDTLDLAGNRLRRSFVDALSTMTPPAHTSLRTARLATDTADADVRLIGTPMWRRSEPGDDQDLVGSITTDLLYWIRACAKS